MLHGHKVSFSLVTRLYLMEIAFSIPFVHPCRAESQPSQQQPLRSRSHIVTNVIEILLKHLLPNITHDLPR